MALYGNGCFMPTPVPISVSKLPRKPLRGMTRACKLCFVPVVLLLAGFFWFVSQHRLIDGDEGFYVLASRLVLQHKVPYVDFFYQQAPLLPYAYAGWLKITGTSWFAARAFSGLLTALLGAAIYEQVCHETGKWLAGLSAVVVFASSSLVFGWLPLVKPFGMAVLFLFLAYVILSRLSSASPEWLSALAGVALGLSADSRSYAIAVAPVFLWWIWRVERARAAVRLLWFVGGLAIGLAPCIALFFTSPDAFLFNNLGYHSLRTSRGLIGDWSNKANILHLLARGPDTGFQFSIPAMICAGLLPWRRYRRDASLLAFLIALVLGVICLLPTPSELQYFSMVVPFLIVSAVCLVSEYVARLQSLGAVALAGAAVLVLLAGFVGFGVRAFGWYLHSGLNVPGVYTPALARNWTLEQVTAVSAAIDQLAMPGEEVLSFWPGYIFASSAEPYPGFENQFGMGIAYALSPEKRQRYHIISEAGIHQAVASHGARIAVVGNQGTYIGGAYYDASIGLLENNGYRAVRRLNDAIIYEYSAAPP